MPKNETKRSKNSKSDLNRKMYGVFENSLLERSDFTLSSYINDISKRLKTITPKKIQSKNQATGVSQCIRAILTSLSQRNNVTELMLCHDIKYSAATVSVSLKKMAYDDLLTLTVDNDDRRRTLISITEKGLETQKYLEEAYKELDGILLKGITEKEKDLMVPLLKQMLKNVLEAQNDPALKDIKVSPCLKAQTTKSLLDSKELKL